MIRAMDKERQGLDPQLARLLEDEADTVEEFDDLVCCKVCSAVLTRRRFAMTVNGSHAHQCVNPHGFEFHLGCYQEALGCAISGERTHADSWFPGFQWRYATCAECQQHVGWYFDRSGEHFYGLIFDRIQAG